MTPSFVHMTTSLKRTVSSAFVAAALVALPACGGDDESAPTGQVQETDGDDGSSDDGKGDDGKGDDGRDDRDDRDRDDRDRDDRDRDDG